MDGHSFSTNLGQNNVNIHPANTGGEQINIPVTQKLNSSPEQLNALNSLENLASTFRNQRRWSEAELLQVQVVEMSKRLLGPEHPDTLNSMANLANVYKTQGRWNEAEQLGVQVMEMRMKLLGPEHPDTLSSMANLASIY